MCLSQIGSFLGELEISKVYSGLLDVLVDAPTASLRDDLLSLCSVIKKVTTTKFSKKTIDLHVLVDKNPSLLLVLFQ